MTKKTIGVILLTMLLLLTLSGYALAAGFTDLQDHWAAGQINKWVDQGLAGGYDDGTFKPDRQVSRAEFVALVNRAFKIEQSNSGVNLSDVKTGNWYYDDVAAATAAGYIGGYADGTFRPNQIITRQEVAGVLVRLLKLTPETEGIDNFADAGQIAQWARGNIGAVVRESLMKGMPDNSFAPQKGISRAEAIVSLDRALGYLPDAAAPGEPQSTKATSIDGKVTYNSAAVPNAVVKIYQADGYEVLASTQTDSSGHFKFNLEPGKYDLTATTDKEVAYKSDVQVTGDSMTGVDLSMQEAAVVTGILKDKNGKPVKNATLIFTTNPTFTVSTDGSGKYTAVLLKDRKYQVRCTIDGKVTQIEEDLQVGNAGQQEIALSTKDATGSSASGGGGGSSDESSEENGDESDTDDDSSPTEKAPVVNSVTFTVDGSPVTVTGSNNRFNVNLTGYSNNSKFTGITVNASNDASKAKVSLLGVSKEITFNQGVGSFSYPMTLSELKMALEIYGSNTIPITVTGKTGLTSNVTVNITI
ncbi:Carboxypeptidase regulatory-like domain-containing protein [Desulfotomaculum arcticum]|uniref:Carboxypeptidase regulatory-like domain-containing protein n=1 Tax=Desulfotruncus arcticus DSM 17038 TaxID=1121424 RepID=A0A1I2X0Y1_9FIRM|nr:S-layer homology domain-containing protein [Desulfotruncus arcticus]SFH07173.1 Carboxypeptidase regulatory-like domain-containing protein [Desulfotomaculum arcticum] [Desulfotruncus arcticus DSM 17038]